MLTNNEKIIIKEFKDSRIPSIYKFDDTDNILYIEHVDFDLCNMLINNNFKIYLDFYSSFAQGLLLKGFCDKYEIELLITEVNDIKFIFTQ